MKIACIADIHLGKSTYSVMDREFKNLPFRTADFMRSFRWIIDKCVNELKPDLVVIGGDVYDSYIVSNPVRAFFSEQISKLMENKIPCIILVGNHDISRHNHSLQDIQELNLKSVKVIDQATSLDFKDHKLLLFPYSLDIEQKKTTIKDSFKEFVQKHKGKKDKPTLFFGHFGVKNAILNEYLVEVEETEEITNTTTTLITEERKQYYSRREDDIDCASLDELGADYVILGDFHRFQRLKTKSYGLYTGSIERTDMTEFGQKKGFVLYDTEVELDKEWGKCRFIEYPDCRPMLEIKGNITEIRSKFNTIDLSKNQEAIVKIIFIGDTEELLDFSSGIDELKKEMEKKIKPIHIFIEQRVRNKKQEQKASELEKEIMEKGYFTDKDVINVINEMVVERITDKEEQKKSIDLIEEIYNEVKDEK